MVVGWIKVGFYYPRIGFYGESILYATVLLWDC